MTHKYGNTGEMVLVAIDIAKKSNVVLIQFPDESRKKFIDELLDGEIFDTLLEARVVMELWRREYNKYRPHSSLGYKPPAPEVHEIKNLTQRVAL